MKRPESLTQLLSNQTLARLERLRLNPHHRQTNRSQGEHLAGKGGTSTEFSDYRDYAPGDDVRYVDWNIFARLNRPYVKLYQFEEEMHVCILVDSSSSMLFEDKLLLAKRLAAAFGMMGLLNMERVSAYSCHQPGQAPEFLPPATGRMNLRRLFAFLEGVEGGGPLPLDHAIDTVLSQHRGKGVVVLLSDFLTGGDLHRSLNRLFSAGLEIFAVQILGPSEVAPEVSGDVRFVDSETSQTLDVSSANDLLRIYQQQRQGFGEHLAQLCRRRNGRFLSVGSHDSVESILFDSFRRQGWIR
jgi:uncharacterized protein (DUF58 family)